MAKVTMPQLGESVAEGTIGKWLKQPGDHVAKYEPLLEVITDKVNAEVPSPFEGVLKEILAEEGATVPNNAEIAVIETADDGAATRQRRRRRATATRRPRPRRHRRLRRPARAGRGRAGAGRAARRRRRAAAPAATAAAPRSSERTAAAPRPATGSRRPRVAATGDADARMTPAVRRLLREHGLTADQIVGTGGGGRITREDVPGRTSKTIRHRSATAAGRPSWLPAAGPRRPPRPRRPPPCRQRRGPAPAAGRAASSITFPDRRGRSPRADDPDAQGHRRPDDPRPRGPARVRAHGGRRHGLVKAREGAKRDYQAREGISLSYVPFVVKAGRRCAQALSGLQRPLDRAGPRRQAPHQHGRRRSRGRWPARAGRPRRGPALDRGLNRAIADVAARARAGKLKLDDSAGARSRSTTPAGSGPT